MRRIGKQGNNILRDERRLERTFTAHGETSWRGVAGGIVFFNNAKTKNGFPYAAAHNVGGPKLPKRRFMWLSAQGRKDIMRDTMKFIVGTGGQS